MNAMQHMQRLASPQSSLAKHALVMHAGSVTTSARRAQEQMGKDVTEGSGWRSKPCKYLQRALRLVWMPALAIVTVCCSIT